MKTSLRLLLALAVVAAAAIGAGLAYPPVRPPLRQAMQRAGLGPLGERLLGAADAAAAVAAVTPVTPLPPAVTVVRASTRAFRDQLFVSGSLVARDEALVGPQIDGLRITEVLAEDGDTVKKGQVLARLDRSQLDALLAASDAALARADASIAQARNQITQFDAANTQAAAELDRARQMQAGVLSQSSFDQRLAASRTGEAQLAAARSGLAVAVADKASQQAQRRELEVRIARTEVRAPVDGLVSRRTARLGALAMNGADPLFRIIAAGEIDLDAEAPDDVLARVRTGMTATIALQGVEDKVEGAVRLISAEVDRTTRLGRVRIALPQGAPARIGSFASAAVAIATRQGIAIPATAVTSRNGRSAVEVVTDGRVAVRQVEVGLVDRGTLEVTSGLVAGETVVARAAAFLREGDAVRPAAVAEEAQR